MDTEVYLNKQSCYRGRAKLRLGNIRFEAPHLPGSRCLDEKNVHRLINIFDAEGCHRLDVEHSIPVLLDANVLTHALQSSNLEQRDLLDARHVPPELILSDDQCVVALHGQHRIEAARQYFHDHDRWWVADLYTSDLNEEVRLALRSDHPNARDFSDGDIFRHLRYFEHKGDIAQLSRWQARLSASKLRDVKTLSSRYPAVMDGFDKLLPFVGLWAPLQLGTFHRILSLNCEEVLPAFMDTHTGIVLTP